MITLHGNAKSERELARRSRRASGTIVIDNADELERARAPGDAASQDVMVRVAPDVRGDTHDHISTGQADTKFGFSLADAPIAMERVRGLRAACASEACTCTSAPSSWSSIRSVARSRRSPDSGPVDAVNVGGGLGVAYTADDHPPPVQDYAAVKVGAIREHFGADVQILDEPGRALVATAGVTLYGVQSVKRNVSTWVAVDGGMSDNLRPMLYGARYEAHSPTASGGSARCHVAGKHCESSDVIVRDACSTTRAPATSSSRP